MVTKLYDLSPLTVTVNYKDSERAKVPCLSVVTVRLSDDRIVAFGTLGGRYSETQALAELKKELVNRNPKAVKHFKLHAGYSIAQTAKLLP